MTSLSMSNKGEVLQNSVENEIIQITKKPIGVTAGIVPWNAPIMVLMRKVIPAVVTGCSVVIKPSEETTLLTLKLAELFRASTIPAGLIQIVPGTVKQLEHNLQRMKIFNSSHLQVVCVLVNQYMNMQHKQLRR